MATQDQSGYSPMDTLFSVDNQISLNARAHSVADDQLKEQFSSVDDSAPKVRKPYTITKQREKWTDEEHKKFLEALKLYGRAWRRIEEHVGSKTAVQIRSHAQKFFSKVVRESSGNNASSVKPIEIPPPRPKRKPMHPYPRKLVNPVKKGVSVPELLDRSASPNLSISVQENRSPMSVLSAVGSDMIASADSNSPTGSMSPVSSAAGANPNSSFLSEPKASPIELYGSPSSVPEAVASSQDDQVSEKFELFPKDNMVAKEGFAEEESMRCLKLFGRTLLVMDSDRLSSPPARVPSDMKEGKHLQMWSHRRAEALVEDARYSHSSSRGEPRAIYHMPFQNGNFTSKEAASAAPMPWWGCYGGEAISFLPSHNCPESIKAHPDSNLGGAQNTGSNNEPVCKGGNGGDLDIQSCKLSFSKEERELGLVCQSKPLRKPASNKHQMSSRPGKFMKGFVPYKRCLAERQNRSSTLIGEEREEQRVHLCL